MHLATVRERNARTAQTTNGDGMKSGVNNASRHWHKRSMSGSRWSRLNNGSAPRHRDQTPQCARERFARAFWNAPGDGPTPSILQSARRPAAIPPLLDGKGSLPGDRAISRSAEFRRRSVVQHNSLAGPLHRRANSSATLRSLATRARYILLTASPEGELLPYPSTNAGPVFHAH
jgi:hypothetical protein